MYLILELALCSLQRKD